MANRKASTSDHLKAHSVAKAELIRDYLKIYLAILEQAKGRRRVFVIDLMCGEGIYKDGKKGTAVQIAETVRHHHHSLKSRNRLTVVLNDNGRSRVEPEKLKVERVEAAVEKIAQALPDHIRFVFSSGEAERVAQEWIHLSMPPASSSDSAKRLFVIDPTGYTQFDVRAVRWLLQHEGTEVFLFLPLPEMYRFVSAVGSDHPLRQIMEWLWRGSPPEFSDQQDFRLQLIGRLRGRFGVDVYTTPIDLAKTVTDHYVLVHATRNLLGLERMVDGKWKMDPAGGQGFVPDVGQTDMFNSPTGVSESFTHALLSYVTDSPDGKTNEDVAVFALTRGMRTMHAKEVLEAAKRQGLIDVVDFETGESARAFYLPYKSQKSHKVLIRPRNRHL